MKQDETFGKIYHAVTKLYNAFHENRLNPNDCEACAVGNICDNNPDWNYFHDANYGEGIIKHPKDLRALNAIEKSGYSQKEIVTIEKVFLESVGWCDVWGRKDNTKENQFNGLCAVIEYLCELEGIPNVMDYQQLFETNDNAPKIQLEAVFSE